MVNLDLRSIRFILDKILKVKVTMMTIAEDGMEKCALMVDNSKRWKLTEKLVAKYTVENRASYALIY